MHCYKYIKNKLMRNIISEILKKFSVNNIVVRT